MQSLFIISHNTSTSSFNIECDDLQNEDVNCSKSSYIFKSFKVIFDHNIILFKYSYCHHFPPSDTPPLSESTAALVCSNDLSLVFLKSRELSAYSCVPYFTLCVCCPSLYLFIPVCFKTILALFILSYIICLLFSVPWHFMFIILYCYKVLLFQLILEM